MQKTVLLSLPDKVGWHLIGDVIYRPTSFHRTHIRIKLQALFLQVSESLPARNTFPKLMVFRGIH